METRECTVCKMEEGKATKNRMIDSEAMTWGDMRGRKEECRDKIVHFRSNPVEVDGGSGDGEPRRDGGQTAQQGFEKVKCKGTKRESQMSRNGHGNGKKKSNRFGDGACAAIYPQRVPGRDTRLISPQTLKDKEQTPQSKR